MNLREATAEKHKIAEKMPFNQRMMQKQLSKLDYLNYINQHFEIFTAIEANDLPHPSLNRTQLISLDIQELQLELKAPNVVLNSTKLYVAYLQNLSYQDLLPHIYLNYLAVMFGGQIIKKVVPSTGNMYEFENMNEAASTIRALQKDEWADEVNKGFDFNIAIENGNLNQLQFTNDPISILKGDVLSEPRKLFLYNELKAIRDNRFKLVMPQKYTSNMGTLPNDGGKDAKTFKGETDFALYDLRRDAGERYNVLEKYPAVVERLQKAMNQYKIELGENGYGLRVVGQIIK